MEKRIIRITSAIKVLIIALVLGMPVTDLMATIKTINTFLI